MLAFPVSTNQTRLWRFLASRSRFPGRLRIRMFGYLICLLGCTRPSGLPPHKLSAAVLRLRPGAAVRRIGFVLLLLR